MDSPRTPTHDATPTGTDIAVRVLAALGLAIAFLFCGMLLTSSSATADEADEADRGVVSTVLGSAVSIVEPVVSVAEPVVAVAEPVVTPVVAVAEPAVTPVVAVAEPIVSPVVAIVEPVVAVAEPVVSVAKPVVSIAKPVLDAVSTTTQPLLPPAVADAMAEKTVTVVDASDSPRALDADIEPTLAAPAWAPGASALHATPAAHAAAAVAADDAGHDPAPPFRTFDAGTGDGAASAPSGGGQAAVVESNGFREQATNLNPGIPSDGPRHPSPTFASDSTPD